MTIDMIAPQASTTYPESPILESKFATPEAPPFWVARPGLVARLAAGAQEPITVVTGPAGCGKTQLVASWAAGRAPADAPAWVTLENEDDQPSSFWTYVIEALRRAAPSLAELPALVPSESLERSSLGRLAAALGELPRPIVLVLDNVSQLDGREWAADLEFVLRHADQRLRLVLVGRWDPPLPLYRYRLAGGLTEIRSGDLAFNADEVARLLDLHDVKLSDYALAALLEHTEGWAAGLRLCASTLQSHRDPEQVVATLSGDDTTIAEYFIGEVLRTQPSEVRRFLVETSVLDDFTPELAEAVTRRCDARRILMNLTRENAFIQPVGGGTGRYRYHRLFAELLRAQLTWEEPDQWRGLHLRASQWLAERGAVTEAAGHAARAGDWTEAARIVVGAHAVGKLVTDGMRGRLGGVFRTMPETADGTETAVVRAALAVADGLGEAAAGYAERCARLSGGEDDALRLARLLVQVHPAVAGDADVVADAIREAETLLAVLPAEHRDAHPELPVLLLAAKGVVQSRAGAVEGAAASFTAAISGAEPGCELPKIDSMGRLALIEAYRGHLNRAETLARQAIELAEQHGLTVQRRPVAGRLALAWIELERYDVEAADRHLRIAQPRCRSGGDPTAVAAFAIVKSRRLQARGELRGAMRVLREAEAVRGAPEWLVRENLLARVRMTVAAGHLDEARELLDRLAGSREPDVSVVRAALLLAGGESQQAYDIVRTVADSSRVTAPVAVDAWLLLAMRAAGMDDVPAARESLRRALRAAAPEAHRRMLNQAWTQLRRVLREDDELVVEYHALGAPSEASARESAERNTDPVLVESLSKRELEVLRGMAAMLPTEEIAASMFVSINTVKTHVRSILRKLSASRRNEAVRRARSLNLI
ncbi:AAA family ATPase [Actinoplanes sp. TBRC 11911]|uniref:LuxR C-terminal-related transcriptional regulator n=1 Tax=Actinoplanes sp. TBRC 11911 TaxID=2729386 RepID=UPI00145CDA6A|nr:LuxR C-terminal-related transcriptional regulator [Actinoplanes sp. TBRC 11911]NMO52254.1 AAA family ATPase [Actinoplanes sp. TBRC 11911]